MSLIKNSLDYILWDILRLRRPKRRGGQIRDGLDGSQPATVTLRTYTDGGDPFDDLIKFHLRNGPGVPSGFRERKDIA